MLKLGDYKYSPLRFTSSTDKRIASEGLQWCSLTHLVLLLLLICLSFFFGLSFDRATSNGNFMKSWSNELGALERSSTRFNGSFDFTNRYRGRPRAEIDMEWDRFTHHPLIDGTASLISVTADDIKRANKTSSEDWLNSTVQYGEANGGGYMATLEMFHQLHCLNMLRKAIHADYYEYMRPFRNGSRSMKLTTHLDHCVEILRQVISCYGDTGLITFHWVQGNAVPYPDFNTWHECKDPEDILTWAREREAPISIKVEKALFENIVEMPRAP